MNVRINTGLSAVVILLANTAWADNAVHVRTIAAAADGFQLVQIGYNKNYFWPYAGIGNTDAGGTASAANCSPAYSTSCSVTLAGTQDANPFLTASHSQASLTQLYQGNPFKFGGGTARADVSTGELGVSAWGTSWGCPSQYCPGSGHVQAELLDTLNFSIAGATAASITHIGVTFDLEGTMTGGAYTSAAARLQFGTASFNTAIYGPGEPAAIPFEAHSSAAGWVSYTVSPDNSGRVTFSGVYALSGASAQIGLFEQLRAESSGGRADYAHTARISLQLPTSVTYTSNSGAFLTATAAVPEPEVYALLLAGLLVVGVWASRRAHCDT